MFTQERRDIGHSKSTRNSLGAVVIPVNFSRLKGIKRVLNHFGCGYSGNIARGQTSVEVPLLVLTFSW